MISLMPGKVIYHIFCSRDIPSISADSYCSCGTPATAAIYMMLDQPRLCHIPLDIRTTLNQLGLARKKTGFIPNAFNAALIGPVSGESRMTRRPEITIQDKKCGRYEMVWTAFLNFRLRNSFNYKANIIVSGKDISSLLTLKINVFFNSLLKNMDSKNMRKYANPTHGAFKIPKKPEAPL